MKKLAVSFVALYFGFTSIYGGEVHIKKGDVSINRKIKTYLDFKNENLERQKYDYSCGSSALATVLRHFYGENITEREILEWVLDFKGIKRKKLEQLEDTAFRLSFLELAEFARSKGYKPLALAINMKNLKKLKVPAIVFVKIRRNEHFTVYRGTDRNFVYLADPSFGNVKIRIDKFKEIFYTRNDPEFKGKILVFIPQKGKKVKINKKFTEIPEESGFIYRLIKVKQVY